MYWCICINSIFCKFCPSEIRYNDLNFLFLHSNRLGINLRNIKRKVIQQSDCGARKEERSISNPTFSFSFLPMVHVLKLCRFCFLLYVTHLLLFVTPRCERCSSLFYYFLGFGLDRWKGLWEEEEVEALKCVKFEARSDTKQLDEWRRYDFEFFSSENFSPWFPFPPVIYEINGWIASTSFQFLELFMHRKEWLFLPLSRLFPSCVIQVRKRTSYLGPTRITSLRDTTTETFPSRLSFSFPFHSRWWCSDPFPIQRCDRILN